MAVEPNTSGEYRRVRTPAGAKRYRLPIGSVISPNGTPEPETKEVTSYARLLSLYRMMLAARRTGQEEKEIQFGNLLRSEFSHIAKNGGAISEIMDAVTKTTQEKRDDILNG